MQDLHPGDYLAFQLEAGFALLRLLAIDNEGGDAVWHLVAYTNLFPSVESAEAAVNAGGLEISEPHLALTNRAFESTQVARIAHRDLKDDELSVLNAWHCDADRKVRDRSIRLLLGLR
jgi:hypothetical protein